MAMTVAICTNHAQNLTMPGTGSAPVWGSWNSGEPNHRMYKYSWRTVKARPTNAHALTGVIRLVSAGLAAATSVFPRDSVIFIPVPSVDGSASPDVAVR